MISFWDTQIEGTSDRSVEARAVHRDPSCTVWLLGLDSTMALSLDPLGFVAVPYLSRLRALLLVSSPTRHSTALRVHSTKFEHHVAKGPSSNRMMTLGSVDGFVTMAEPKYRLF